MKLKVKVVSQFKNDVFQGKLYFKSNEKKMVVDYFLADNTPSGQPNNVSGMSIKDGDKVDITFKIDGIEMPLKGIFPEGLKSFPDMPRYIFELTYRIIRRNVFYLSQSIGVIQVNKISEEILYDNLRENVVKALFGE
jgi:hypothetical protein